VLPGDRQHDTVIKRGLFWKVECMVVNIFDCEWIKTLKIWLNTFEHLLTNTVACLRIL
jgi:hypothetical protein